MKGELSRAECGVGGRTQTRQRGLATLVAMSLIVTIGAALIVMAQSLQRAAARSQRSVVEAQLRQLLEAGGRFSVLTIKQKPGREDVQKPLVMSVALPAEVVKQGGKLTLRRVATVSGLEQDVRVEAEVGGERMAEEMRYVRGPREWVVVETRLQGK